MIAISWFSFINFVKEQTLPRRLTKRCKERREKQVEEDILFRFCEKITGNLKERKSRPGHFKVRIFGKDDSKLDLVEEEFEEQELSLKKMKASV